MNDRGAAPGRDIMDREAFARILSRPQIAGAFFLPIDRARWIGDCYTLGPDAAPLAKGQFAGVRLRAPDPSNIDAAPARQVQGDLTELVRSVKELRKHPDLAGVVLSSEIVVARDNSGVARARFGLRSPSGSGVRNDVDAAQECHRMLALAIRKAGMSIDESSPPDLSHGFDGLNAWATAVRLKAGPPFIVTLWPWLVVIGLVFGLWRGCGVFPALSN